MPGVLKIIPVGSTQPYRLFSPSPVPGGLSKKTKEIDSMPGLRVIEMVEESTEWCSCLTIASKANSGLRMGVDLICIDKDLIHRCTPYLSFTNSQIYSCNG